ncbi:hypothetical protein O5624_03705 [Escherichia coli]|nr:hypothetical protein [Escherichia coli]
MPPSHCQPPLSPSWDAVVALPFAADACLLASSFEADADDADDAAELARTMQLPF